MKYINYTEQSKLGLRGFMGSEVSRPVNGLALSQLLMNTLFTQPVYMVGVHILNSSVFVSHGWRHKLEIMRQASWRKPHMTCSSLTLTSPMLVSSEPTHGIRCFPHRPHKAAVVHTENTARLSETRSAVIGSARNSELLRGDTPMDARAHTWITTSARSASQIHRPRTTPVEKRTQTSTGSEQSTYTWNLVARADLPV